MNGRTLYCVIVLSLVATMSIKSDACSNTRPQATIAGSGYKWAHAGYVFIFECYGYDDDGYIDRWELDFDDDSSPEEGDGYPPGHPEIDHTYSSAGNYYWAKLTVWDNQGAYDSEYCKVHVVSLSNTAIRPYVPANTDDDNENGQMDTCDGGEQPEEDDLLPQILSVVTPKTDDKVRLTALGADKAKVQVWGYDDKQILLIPDGGEYYKEWGSGSVPSPLYVEGLTATGGQCPVQLSLAYRGYWGSTYVSTVSKTAQLWVHVVEVDMDMDGVDDTGGETEEITPGGFIPLNDDDDDEDTYVDKDDPDGVAGGDDDLVKLTNFKLLPEGSIYPPDVPVDADHPIVLSVPSGASKIRIYENASKSTPPLSLPKSYTSRQALPSELWVEGIATSDGVRDITLALQYTLAGKTFEDIINVTVIRVTEVEWETYGSNVELDSCPKNTGSKRIFPGKQAPDDPQATDRNIASVKATITPAVSGATVFFDWWDVDDPSSDTSPIDVDGPNGDDNRGSGEALSADSNETDSSGVATVYFTVSMRPGDNFKIAASASQTRLSKVTQEIIDFDSLPAGIVLSEMLTTWRKLHVEVDAMSNPPASEPFGLITGTSGKITNIQLYDQGTPGWPDNKLEGSVLDPEGTSPSNSVDYANLNTFEVNLNSSTLVAVLTDYRYDDFDNDSANGIDDGGEIFTMSDYAADPSNDPYGINTDDPKWGTDLTPPSASTVISGMNGYFNDAYIEVEEQTTGNEHPSFDFVRMTIGQLATVDVPGDSSYWCVTVSWAYESADKKDLMICSAGCTDHDFYSGDDDPENEGVPAGYRVSTYGIASGIPGESCMIFLEIQRDRGGLSIPELVCHEVGHCFGLYHATYTGAFEEDKDGIMGWQNFSVTCWKDWYDIYWAHESPDRFSYQNIADLRSSATD